MYIQQLRMQIILQTMDELVFSKFQNRDKK